LRKLKLKIMRNFETLSSSAFDAKVKDALLCSPIRKEVSLKDIDIIKNNVLRYQDKQIVMEPTAFKGLCKIVGLPTGFDKTFSEAFGDKARQQLVNRLKVAVQAKGKTTVSLVINPDSRRIVSVQSDPKNLVSNKTFIDTSSRIIDKYGLEVNNFSVGKNGGVVINASSIKNSWGITGIKGEDHYGGISFVNSPDGGYKVSPFMWRLICANGLIGTAFEETLSLGQMDARTMEGFWSMLNDLAARNFRPSSFEEKVKLAMNTNASLAELQYAHDIIKNCTNAEYKELESWIPLVTTKDAFHRAHIDTIFMSKEQMKNARTGTSVYDLVNGLTNFGSADYGFKISDYDQRKLQLEAGRLLTKKFDMANQVKSPFEQITSHFGTAYEATN
jgi:hypothetical protein